MSAVQLTLADTRSLEAQRPRDLMGDALTWIDTNREAWEYLVRVARDDAHRIKRVRVKSYIEDLRTRRLPYATRYIKLPNAFSAPLGRILASWYPDIAPYIPLKHSKTDGCAVPPCPAWARGL